MIVINYITGVIDRTASYIKTARGVAGVLAAIKRTFGETHLFNRALGG